MSERGIKEGHFTATQMIAFGGLDTIARKYLEKTVAFRSMLYINEICLGKDFNVGIQRVEDDASDVSPYVSTLTSNPVQSGMTQWLEGYSCPSNATCRVNMSQRVNARALATQ